MKIAFLTTRTDKPSARLRFLQYLPYLEEYGLGAEVLPIPDGLIARRRLFKSLAPFDGVFLQKKLFGPIEWRILRKNAKRIIYDFDDAVMFKDDGGDCAKRMRAFKRTAAASNAVIAGNSYLEGFALECNKNTVTIPTPIDMKRYTAKSPAAASETITLGWIGSRATLPYLSRMRDSLDSIHRLHPATRLKIVADEFFECASMPVMKKRWDYDEEISDLHSFDIGLMPLADDPWARGKCGFKLLQYMAVGLPAVASRVGVNCEIISHGENGLLAGDSAEWVECISKLISSRDLRIRLGQRARRTVLERYSLESNAPRLAKALV